MEKDFMNITVVVAGRPYSLKIKKSEEQLIRRVTDEVNDKIDFFQQTYKQRDKKDCLSMALLTYAVEAEKHKEVINDKKVNDKVERLEKLLDEALSELQ